MTKQTNAIGAGRAKMWRIFGIVATFQGLVFVCRQLNQGWVGPNPPCNKRLKMPACWGSADIKVSRRHFRF
jgi:hypothetical protein